MSELMDKLGKDYNDYKWRAYGREQRKQRKEQAAKPPQSSLPYKKDIPARGSNSTEWKAGESGRNLISPKRMEEMGLGKGRK